MTRTEAPSLPLERGVFTLSFDLELIWGTLDLHGPEGFRERCETERGLVIDRLLELLTELGIPATWCTVGHLLLARCVDDGGGKHPEIVRPNHAWSKGDWFRHDPGGDECSAPTFLGRSIIQKIRACPVEQEIGCHSFSHVIFGDPGCSRATAWSEVAACVRTARDLGLELSSFSFPRNRVGHLDVLREHGFRCFRGPEPRWYRRRPWPALLERAVHLFEVLAATEPPVVTPQRTEQGLWNIPGSMILFPRHGARRFIPCSLRVKRALRGLEAAARLRGIFHLWLHPTNLVDGMEEMFAGLGAILQRASELRAKGELAIATMGGIAGMAEGRQAPP